MLCISYNALIITCLSRSAGSLRHARGSKTNSLSFQTSLGVLTLPAWAQNVSSDKTAGRPWCALHRAHTASPAPPRRGWEVRLSSPRRHLFPRLLLRLHYASFSPPLLHIYPLFLSFLLVGRNRATGRHKHFLFCFLSSSRYTLPAICGRLSAAHVYKRW